MLEYPFTLKCSLIFHLKSRALVAKVKCQPADLVVPGWMGWSGGAMVLGKLPVPGRPTCLDKSRARAYCTCIRCGWGLFGHFYSHLFFLSFLPLFGRRPDID